jgi:hypothetical protein
MKSGTKRKTSVSLSRETAKTLGLLAGRGGNRSAVIEVAIQTLWTLRQRDARDASDRRILEQRADALGEEALDVLSYQVEL